MKLCAYKDIFGKPGEGLHKYRIFNIAVVDVAFTVVAAYAASKLFRGSFIYYLVALFVLGILLHWLFCVPTTLNKFIFQ